MDIGLPAPPEPKEIKEFIKKLRGKLGLVPDINHDSLAVWYLNKLPSYLWKYWKPDLESAGYTWQKFIKVMKYATDDIIDWALYDNLKWNELVKKLVRLLERYASVRG